MYTHCVIIGGGEVKKEGSYPAQEEKNEVEDSRKCPSFTIVHLGKGENSRLKINRMGSGRESRGQGEVG